MLLGVPEPNQHDRHSRRFKDDFSIQFIVKFLGIWSTDVVTKSRIGAHSFDILKY